MNRIILVLIPIIFVLCLSSCIGSHTITDTEAENIHWRPIPLDSLSSAYPGETTIDDIKDGVLEYYKLGDNKFVEFSQFMEVSCSYASVDFITEVVVASGKFKSSSRDGRIQEIIFLDKANAESGSFIHYMDFDSNGLVDMCYNNREEPNISRKPTKAEQDHYSLVISSINYCRQDK